MCGVKLLSTIFMIVLPGEAGSGKICPNGGGALLCKEGDILVIWANEERDLPLAATS